MSSRLKTLKKTFPSDAVAVISDVHGNAPALEAVLSDIKVRKIRHIWHLGDFIGYGPYPNKVVRALRRPHIINIVGNYDRNVLRLPKKKKKWQKSKHPLKYFSLEWAHQNIKEDHKKFLKALPEQVELVWHNKRVLLVHGSPEDISEPLTGRTPLKRYRELAKAHSYDIICFGHTHEFILKKIGKTIFLNPGSVGRTFTGDPKASYAILMPGDKGPVIEQVSLVYDLKRTLKKMRRKKMPEMITRSIEEGKSLDAILEEN